MTKASCDQLLEALWASLSEEVVVMIIKYSAEINDDAIVVNL